MKKLSAFLFLFISLLFANHAFAQSGDVYEKAADGYFSDKNFQSAYDNYGLAIKKTGHDDVKKALLYSKRGMSLHQLGRNDEALNDYAKSIELNPQNADVYWNRGVILDGFRKFSPAIEDYKKSIALITVNKRDGANLPLSILYCNIAWDQFWLGNLTVAFTADSMSISLNDQFSRSLQLRGLINYSQKNYTDAIDDFTKAIFSYKGSDPNVLSFIYTERADAKRELKQYKDAINDYSQAIALSPNNGLAYWNRGATYHYNSDYKLATDDYSAAIPFYKDDNISLSKLYDDKGLNEAGQNLFKDAIRDDSVAIALNPANTNAYFNKATAYTQNGDYQQGIDLYAKLLDFFKDKDKALAFIHYMIANNEYFLGQFDKVVADCTKAIALNPNYSASYYYRGKVYLKKMSNKDLAIKDFNKVLSLDTTKKTVDYIFSLFYTGKGDEAATILQNDIIGTTNDAQLLSDYYNMACLYSLMNKPDEANIYLKKAIDAGYAKKYAIADEDLDNIRKTEDYKATIAGSAN